MTHEQKPESAEFRTREAQLSALMGVIGPRQEYPMVAELLTRHIAEAEARGAAEQRRKDAEGEEPVKWQRQNPGHGWIDTAEEDLPFYKERGFLVRPLYTRSANIAALIAEAVEAERGRCIEIVRKHGISPFPIDDPHPTSEAINATLQNITEAIREGKPA